MAETRCGADMIVKRFLKSAVRAAGFDVRRLPQAAADVPPSDIADGALYQPVYSPWLSSTFIAEYMEIAPYTLVSEDRWYVLATVATQAARLDAEVWECGVYRGGTAMLLAKRLSAAARVIRLFDGFEGMPETDAARDWHKAGDFHDTSLGVVQSRVRDYFLQFHKGPIPEIFLGLEVTPIAFAHVDADIYSAIHACCEFIFPRLCVGGFMVFDDYGFPTCPGARSAVGEFFPGHSAIPLVLPT
jgi:O-methyltransferase